VQEGPLFNCLTNARVILERSEESQSGVDFNFYTILHFSQFLFLKMVQPSLPKAGLNLGEIDEKLCQLT